MLDQWREYTRECTSWVAWALYSRNGFIMPFHANAKDWGPIARRLGFAVNQTPAPGAVAWSNAHTWGHVAYVVRVEGPNIYIEEYNEYGTGRYDARTVAASAFTGFIHFRDLADAPPSTPVPAPSTTTVSTSTTVVTETATSTLANGSTTTTTTVDTKTYTAPQPPSPPSPHAETVGGATNTWTNYSNAGGNQGPTIGTGQSVEVACKVSGFRVADGDTWWYRIASAPWSINYYASADAFYNNGQTTGSLIGTPFVDGSVPNC